MRFWIVSGLVMAGLVVGGVWAQSEVIGRVNYLQGDVQVTRNGAVLPAASTKIGMMVENSDQFKTGPSGLVELALDKSTGLGAIMTIKASSMALISLSGTTNKTGSVDLLAGSVGLKVDKLASGNKLDVHTEQSVMGVRGTEFTVQTGLDGEVLLQTPEGRVEVTDEQGRSRFSEPGVVVQYDQEGDWQTKQVAVADLAKQSQAWQSERQALFLAHPERAVERNLVQYEKLKAEFESTWTSFKKQEVIYRKWMTEPGFKDQVAAKKEAAGMAEDLIKMRQAAIRLARMTNRLEAAELFLGKDKLEGLRLKNGQKVADLMPAIRQARQEQFRRFAEVHFVAKLFHQRTGTEVPRSGR